MVIAIAIFAATSVNEAPNDSFNLETVPLLPPLLLLVLPALQMPL